MPQFKLSLPSTSASIRPILRPNQLFAMSDPATRAVLFFNSMSSAGGEGFVKAAFSPKYFPTRTLPISMALSGIAGYCFMDNIQRKRAARNVAIYQQAWQGDR